MQFGSFPEFERKVNLRSEFFLLVIQFVPQSTWCNPDSQVTIFIPILNHNLHLFYQTIDEVFLSVWKEMYECVYGYRDQKIKLAFLWLSLASETGRSMEL